MILTIIWAIMMIAGIVYTCFSSGVDNVVLFLNNGLNKTLELFITLLPIMCFWSGIMEIAEKSSITKIFSKLLSPITKVLFKDSYHDKASMKKICMNMSANILGMGNAATPLGLDAMENLDKLNPTPSRATDAMCMFIVINTASIQLIPTSVIALRAQYGSSAPSDILIPTIITTISAFIVGTTAARICARLPFFR